jgi:tetratricopeptide (TPR) repeat protein
LSVARWMPRLVIRRKRLLGGAFALATVVLLWWMLGTSLLIPTPVLPTLSPERRLVAANDDSAQRPVQALYHLEALAVETGWTPARHQQAGDLWARLGDMQQAIYHWQQGPTDDPLLLRSLAAAYITGGDWRAAINTLERLVALRPEDPWTNYNLGLTLALYDPDAAEAYLRRAALDPTYQQTARAVRVTLLEHRDDNLTTTVGLPILVGLTLIDRAEWTFAELAFSYANAIYLGNNGDPLPEALAYLSLVQNERGKDGSIAIESAVALAPNDAQVRFFQALHERHQKNYAGSLNAMIQAVALSPESPVLYAELGTAYRLVGDVEQAQYWLQAAVDFSGGDPQFQALLTAFYTEEAYNLGGDGLMALGGALRNNPTDPDLLAGMGWAYSVLGDTEGGEAMIDEALSLAPDNPRARYYKARILLGRVPDDPQARELLTTLIADGGPFQTEAQRILNSLPELTDQE